MTRTDASPLSIDEREAIYAEETERLIDMCAARAGTDLLA